MILPDWTKQHCGVHQSTYEILIELMPDLKSLLETFPDNPNNYTWDVKIHMLMPGQYPCIPNWHYDNIPRVNGKQDFSRIQPELPMWLWISGAPLTEFEQGKIPAKTWVKFTQKDLHRGTVSKEFTWRCFIRATHNGILPPKLGNNFRRHTQVYLDAQNFSW